MATSNHHFRPLAASALLFASAAHGGELRYGAALHEAAWEVAVSRQECRLVQEIPYYGRAVLARKAGQELTFSLTVRQALPREGTAELHSLPPAWIHTAPPAALAKVSLTKGATPLVLTGDGARQVLAELEKGMFPTLTYRDWGDQHDQVVVSVSAINLRRSLPPFLGCLQGLLPYEFNDVRSSTIHFGLASASLDPADRRRLQQLAEYLRADDKVKGLQVIGYTDSLGLRKVNKRLSVRRAAAVRDFLVQNGVPAEKIKLEHRGEESPRASNRSDDGRAANRRVEVTLLQ